jgi:hypothetical protein
LPQRIALIVLHRAGTPKTATDGAIKGYKDPECASPQLGFDRVHSILAPMSTDLLRYADTNGDERPAGLLS